MIMIMITIYINQHIYIYESNFYFWNFLNGAFLNGPTPPNSKLQKKKRKKEKKKKMFPCIS